MSRSRPSESGTTCRVIGEETVFSECFAKHKLDPAYPLVADYNGAQINTSFQEINQETGKVTFYAPVFAGIEYRLAALIRGSADARMDSALPSESVAAVEEVL